MSGAIALPSILAGCSGPQALGPDDKSPVPGRIDLGNPQIGQESRYVRWEGKGYLPFGEPMSMSYVADTIVARVLQTNPIMVEESYTAGSLSLRDTLDP